MDIRFIAFENVFMGTYRHQTYYIFIFLSILTGTYSCKNEESDVGSSFFQSHANAIEIDTVTVNMETVWLDSVATSNTGVILLGSVSDSFSGNKQASSYMQLGAPTVRSIDPTAVYDSLCFLLKPNRYVTGDSTKDFSIAVYALNALIAPATNQTALYNTSSFPYDHSPLGTWSGRIYPTRTDSISIPLSDALGQKLFSAIVYNPGNLSTDDLFRSNYLKGVVLTGGQNKAVFGFMTGDSSGLIRLYYHNANHAGKTLHTDFRITRGDLQFNHIDNDLSHTPLAGLNSSNKIISARAAGGISVLQPLGNLAIRLDFPYLQNLLHLGRYVEVLGARLILYPKPGTYSADAPLPPLLSLCEIQHYYTVLDSLSDAGGVQHGNLKTDYSYSNSYYTYDITQHLLYNMQTTNVYNQTKLLLVPPRHVYDTTLKQLVLSRTGIDAKVELVMYNDQ